MTIPAIVKSLFRINRWPFYISYIYLKNIQRSVWRSQNISVGIKNQWLGFPIITNAKGASIEIGNECLICSLSTYTALGVSHKTIIRTLTKKAKIKVGNNVKMSGTTICSAVAVSIGNRCLIGADVIISDTDFHSLDSKIRNSSQDQFLTKSKPIIIGNDVFIGGRSIILKGVTLGDKVIVGAGSIVTKSFTEGAIIAGNPAVEIGKST